MAFNLANVSAEKVIRAPRIVLLGTEKMGKTTMACGSHFENGVMVETGLNSPIVIPVKGEEGADSLGIPLFPTAMEYGNVLEAIDSLYSEEHDRKTVVIDSASALEPLVWDDVCRVHNAKSIEDVGGGYGKGYTEALGRWREILSGLDALRNEKNMSSIIIGHVKAKRFDDPTGDSYDTYTFDLNDKAANLIFRWADLILFANTKVVVKKADKGFGQTKNQAVDITKGQRFLFTQKRPAHPGGGRGVFGALPYEMPLDWKLFMEEVEKASK